MVNSEKEFIARENIKRILDNGEFKDRILNVLDKLHVNRELNDFAAQDQREILKKEKTKNFVSKVGGLVIGGGLLAGGGALVIAGAVAVAPVGLAIGAVTAIGGGLLYGKTISDMMSPNAKLHLTKNKIKLSENDSDIAKKYFENITELAIQAQVASYSKSPDAESKMEALKEKLENVENSKEYLDSSNTRSIDNMRLKSKETFMSKLGEKIKSKSIDVVKNDLKKGFQLK